MTLEPPPNSDEYDGQVIRLRKRQDWEGLVRYCRSVDRQIRNAFRQGEATDDEKRLRIQALMDLQTTYMILDLPQRELKAAQEAHSALQDVSVPLDDLRNHFSYTALARAYKHNGQPDQAREMLLRSITSLLSRRQAEFVGNGLLELAALEREADNPQIADVLASVAGGVKRAARRAHKETS